MASQEAMDKYLDSLNQAMAMHAAAAVQNLKFNKTEIAEIVDNTNRNEGWYVVSNGAFKYNAFSENTTYTIGMQVHVNIPNNDYTGQKTIIGQYKREGEQGVWYRSPWENFSPDVNNIILDTLYKDAGLENTTEGKLVANWDLTVTNSNEVPTEEGPKAQRIVLYRSDSLNDANKIKQRSYQDYKFIGIKADFKTLFSELNVGSGDYGIRVTLQYDKKDETIEDIKYTYQTLTLGTGDMVGSIYNFNTYYTQEALYELQKDEGASLNAISVELYQNGDFISKNGDIVAYSYQIGEEEKRINNPNILMRGLDIRFGNGPIDKDNTIQIYTTNGLTYDSAQKDSLNSKNIYLRWNHLDSTTNTIKKAENASEVQDFSEIQNNYKIHWYKDSIHTANEYLEILDANNEKYKEQNSLINKWKEAELNDQLNLEDKKAIRKEVIDSFNLGTDLYNADDYTISAAGETQINQSLRTSARSKKASNVLAGEFWEPIDVSTTSFELKFQPNNDKQVSKVMAIVEYGPQNDGVFDTTSYEYHMIKSNVLEFNNMREVPQSATSDQFNGLKVYFEDNSDGNYPLYSGTTNEVLNRSDITRTRKLKAEYYSTSNGESYFNGNETIIWQIPVINTMIAMSESFYGVEERIYGNDSVFTNYKSIIGDFDANYMYLKRSIENSSKSVETTQQYQIEKFYKKSAVNNSVYCYVIKNNQMAKTSVTMYFSQHGTSGTDYTFSLGLGPLYKISDAENAEWIEVGPPDTAITLNDEYYREIIFELYDSKNEKIDLTDDQKNDIINSWVAPNANGYYSGLNNVQILIDNGKTTPITIPNIQFKIIKNNDKYVRVALRAKNSKLSRLAESYFNSTQRAIEGYSNVQSNIALEKKHFEPIKKELEALTAEINKIIAEKNNIPDDDPNKDMKIKKFDYIKDEKQQALDILKETKVKDYNDRIKEFNKHLEAIKKDFDYHWWQYEDAVSNYLEPFRYIILKASIWSNVIGEEDENSRRIKFEQYLPLHFRAPHSTWCLQGSDIIVYDDKGSNPSCNNDVYKLIDGATGTAIPMDIIDRIAVKENPDSVEDHDSEDEEPILEIPEVPEVTDYFHIYVDNKTNDKLIDKVKDGKTLTSGWDYPSFRIVEDNEGAYLKMVVPSMYLSDQSKNICIEAPGLYTCPLLIIQNKYQIPALNEWDGELLVDGTKNEVLAAMIGAGHKNSNNTFTGVAMGDVTHTEGKLSGLFGYNEGARVFELNTNGEAFIGKSGNGRIYIDGNTGTIKSAAREVSATKGTEFNLKDNYIDIRSSADNNSSRIHLDVTTDTNKNDTGAYFSIDSNNGHRLINIANNDYYLQTDNYVEEDLTADPKVNGSGLKIDLKNGVFNSYGKLTINGNSQSSINFGSATNGYKFKVSGNGDVTLGKLNFVDNTGAFVKISSTDTTGNSAKNIQPKWMTFVTDITGSVALQKVTVTMSNIPVPHTTKTVSSTITRVYNTSEHHEDFHWYSDSSAYQLSSNPSNRVYETTVPYRDGLSADGITPKYRHEARVKFDVTNSNYVEGDPVVSTTTKTEYVNGTGSTDVPVVTAINFTITKISMWALTNSTVVQKSYAINAKGTGGTYTGTVETHTMEEVNK